VFYAGVIIGNDIEGILTALMSIFTTIGPENTVIYFSRAQESVYSLFKSYERDAYTFLSTLDKSDYKDSFLKYHKQVESFNFLITYHLDQSKEIRTDKILFYLDKMIEKNLS
jgi:hypothetical protein